MAPKPPFCERGVSFEINKTNFQTSEKQNIREQLADRRPSTRSNQEPSEVAECILPFGD